MNTRVKIGELEREEGELAWIGDPSFFQEDEEHHSTTAAEREIGEDWNTLLKHLAYPTRPPAPGGYIAFDGLGVVVRTEKGTYPVYATFDTNGYITSVTITFTEEKEEH